MGAARVTPSLLLKRPVERSSMFVRLIPRAIVFSLSLLILLASTAPLPLLAAEASSSYRIKYGTYGDVDSVLPKP